MPHTLFIGANVDFMSTLRVERTLLSAAFAVAFDFDFDFRATRWMRLIESSPERMRQKKTGATKGQHRFKAADRSVRPHGL
jgi:hypothetical protein